MAKRQQTFTKRPKVLLFGRKTAYYIGRAYPEFFESFADFLLEEKKENVKKRAQIKKSLDFMRVFLYNISV